MLHILFADHWISADANRSRLLIVRRSSGGDPGLELVQLILGEAANRVLLLKFWRRHLLAGDFSDKQAVVRFSGNDRRAGFASLQQARPSAKGQAAFLLSPTMANEAFGFQDRSEDFALVYDLVRLTTAVLERASFDPAPNGVDIGLADSRPAHGHLAGNHHAEDK